MGYALQIRGDGVPMWYSSALARRAGSTHAWTVDGKEADVFTTRKGAEDFRAERLMGDPEIKVVPHGAE